MEEQKKAERGFLLHVFHRQHKGRDVIYAVGRLESGQTFGLMDNRATPAFYCRAQDGEIVRREAAAERAEWVDVPFYTLDGDQVARVECRRVGGLRRLAKRLEELGVRTYEADLNYALHYLIERGLRGSVLLHGEWQQGQGVDRVYVDPRLEPVEWQPQLSMLVLDIETAPDASEVYAVSFVGGKLGQKNEVEEIHLVGAAQADAPANLYCYADERALLKALAARVRQIDPDVLSGWNVIDFDLAVLQRRFAEHELEFNLGRTQDASWFRASDVWGGSRMVVYGRQILDGLHLVRGTLQRFDDYRLGTVAQAILGRGKTLQPEDDETMPEAIIDAYTQDRDAFCEYCLEDSRLVWDMLEAEGLIELTLRRALLTGLPLERSWGSVAAFDLMYISELRRRNLVAPTTGVDRKRGKGAPGGLVMEPRAGLYRHVFVFDFKSLYPSIMRTFNIDPLSHVRGEGDDEAIEAPNGARFSRERGILPDLLETFWASREEAKARGDAVASYAYKIIMNSFYGVLATGSCRFANSELAGAITEFGHYILRWTKGELERRGNQVLYGDTDSVFIDAGLALDCNYEEAQQAGASLCVQVDWALKNHLEERYGLESRLELEFEKYYERFLLPPMRGSEKGRAKGYAGWLVDAQGGRLEIIGMEAVRRDWTALAQKLQRRLLELLFSNARVGEIEACVSEWVRSLRAGERDDELVYHKSLRKPVSEYTRNVPPHVQAAKMLPKPRGVIHYVVTHEGPQPLGHLCARPDYDHYVEKQIEPLVRTIAQVYPIDLDATIKGVGNLFAADVWLGTKERTRVQKTESLESFGEASHE